MSFPRPAALIVLDGWGYRESSVHNAVALARTPTMDALLKNRPNTLLRTSGLAVGLPDGQMGNSEVGHLNLGAGRVVNQDIVRVAKAIENGEFMENNALLGVIRAANSHGGAVHIIGLVSDGGVHSHQDHAVVVARLAHKAGAEKIWVHAYMDGRDTPPCGGLKYLEKFEADLKREAGAEIATVSGRYYAMDRDQRWERTKRAYDAMVLGEGISCPSALSAIRESYAKDVTDEFIEPHVVHNGGESAALIRDGDAVICFNFRSDRARQISRALTDDAFDGFERKSCPHVHYACMTEYDESLGLPVAFPPVEMRGLFSHALAAAGKNSLRVAETEKYPHVTYFFNGGEEEPPPGERREMVPSPKVATYDLQPEMSAASVQHVAHKAIESGKYDAIVLNLANPDMVGHTGVEAAAITAVETTDACLGRILEAIEHAGGAAVVTADHGNCEHMWDDENNCPHTAHSLNDTPCIVIAPGFEGPLRAGGALCDVAPTLLGLMGVAQPPEMTGKDLRIL
ncbi:MAG: 2,3-bisphosphoglycerate-independent phosphoglycerate mutase [Nitrospinaceae bacterium]|nr:2,3-bisphosphoglycerate-independent phosphoglycerate mutase [Nitrospinaceae bacterium]MBT3435621.1 2,3-bisphosphoglycerate-independent phosphoglycerate mutase [Nitrospinaceae bacterium]MBT3819863.1 2,3-bisphosphoglycerate-independent phosphoglycerate mutase [Nitrospinaceae bacterium]MBT4092775.1 2,3-bisphosphoglycerate-independent phosphoglycerate mutase [Nitrospinaceae bacterium]MBT4431248.1 2,3-bisphosphoglycerate-independent phosphoglycerate mutase [Nitrospinaceae bacterium]